MVQACSQAENDWRSENIVWGLRRRAEDGTSGLYSRVCYGHKKDKHGMLIIDEDQAMWRLLFRGMGLVGVTSYDRRKRQK